MPITVFIDLCPDELICSAGGKYQDLFNFPHRLTATSHFFGSCHAKAILDLPYNLSFLLNQLPPGHQYTLDELINDYTLFRLFRPFLPAERLERIKQALQYPRARNINIITGGLACKVKQPPYFLLCPRCVVEDREAFGQCFFHRSHHAPGVRVCHKHAIWLETTDASTKARRGFISAESVTLKMTPRPIDEQNNHQTDLLTFARNIAWLLNYEGDVPDIKALRQHYLHLMIERDYASATGHIHTGQLTSDFKRRFDHEFLLHMDSTVEDRSQRNWVARIAQSKQIQHPIRHLLFMQFLGCTAEEVLAKKMNFAPFGNGPWPCLNPVCSKYHESVIQTCRLGFTRSRRRQVQGVFECSYCGFIYSRTGPDRSPNARLKWTKIITHGTLWDEQLKCLWADPSVHIKDMVNTFQVGYDTIHRQVHRLGLSERSSMAIHPTQTVELEPQISLDTIIFEYRIKWLCLIQDYPTAGVVALQKIAPSIYRILDRFDFQWLSDNKPRSTGINLESKGN